MNTKIKLTLMSLAVIAFSSCSGNKSENSVTNENMPQGAAANADIKGEWLLENIVFNDSDYVRPVEEVPGVSQYIVFEDNTYFIRTNCNTISGEYVIKGDSITLGDGAMTEMACDNMATEDALRKMLPDIATVYIQNDTIARLDSRNPSEYIVLRRATEKKTSNLI